MERTNFWDDAARWGALLALVQIVFSTIGIFWKSSLLSLISLVVVVTLLYLLTKRRTMLYGGDGYSYGACMKYIFWMTLFSGILIGAWEIAARNVIFTSYYKEALDESLKLVAPLYSKAQLEMASSMVHDMFFSPIWVVVLSILGAVLQGCFFGLFICAFTKRDMPWPTRHDGDAPTTKDDSNE